MAEYPPDVNSLIERQFVKIERSWGPNIPFVSETDESISIVMNLIMILLRICAIATVEVYQCSMQMGLLF